MKKLKEIDICTRNWADKKAGMEYQESMEPSTNTYSYIKIVNIQTNDFTKLYMYV